MLSLFQENPIQAGLVVAAMLAVVALAVWLVLSRRGRKPGAPLQIDGGKASGGVGGIASGVPAKLGESGREKLLPTGEKRAEKVVEKPTAWRDGLAKTRGGFVARIAGLLGKKEIDPSLLDQLEEVLLTADIGVRTSQKLFDSVKERLSRDQIKDSAAVWATIKEESRGLLRTAGQPLDTTRARPFVVLTLGVNGAGKTTTIGKLAARFIGEGKKVLLAAGDTFRAAATEQLEIWGQRVGAEVVRGKEGGDPSAVIFDAVRRAKAESYDVVIADTAGRLQTKSELMDELQKVRRVIQKVDPTAPHETLLVLDATNGQNAISQAQIFKQAMDISGIVLTKLDGTAKGGVILGICNELQIPVRFVGIGEKVADLRVFDPADFVDALFEHDEAAA